MSGQAGPWSPCCCDCWSAVDDFNRPPSSDPGPNWSARSGQWSIQNNISRLHEAGTASARVIFQPSGGKLSWNIQATVWNIPTTAMYDVIVNWLNDNNYQFARFEFDSTQLVISLFSVIGGNPIPYTSCTIAGNYIGTTQELDVCFSQGYFSARLANISTSALWVPNPVVIANGYLAGLGNGNTVPIDFVMFDDSENHWTNASCPPCLCDCIDQNVEMMPSQTLHLTLSAPSGALSSCLNGLTFTLQNSCTFEWQSETKDLDCSAGTCNVGCPARRNPCL